MKIGVLGGGQLGWMMILAGSRLGLTFRIFDPSPDAPAGRLGDHVTGAYADDDAVERFVTGLDGATYEFENVPVETARLVATRVQRFHPRPQVLEVAQDRLLQKQLFQRLGLPLPRFAAVDDATQLDAALTEVGAPAVLKSRRWGYDGKGQHVLKTPDDLNRVRSSMGQTPSVLEAFVPFDRELSVIAARSTTGETAFYPASENIHSEGILRVTRAPAVVDAAQQVTIRSIIGRLLDELNYVGVIALEFFEKNGALLINELATRVHNTGHWTIEGAATSQFENHLRAILGWPLGSTAAIGHSGMINLIGVEPDRNQLLSIDGAHVYLYGKPAAPGRKLGHITVVAATGDERDAMMKRAESVKLGACP